jgi:hypothetical protein
MNRLNVRNWRKRRRRQYAPVSMAASSQNVAFFLPLIILLATPLATILVHGLALMAIIRFIRLERRLGRIGVRLWRDMATISGVIMLAMIAHLVESTIWAIVFSLCGEFGHLAGAFYHSAMNFTTRGYGDVVTSSSWKLCGPLGAADGMLMFGVSIGMIFAVIQRMAQTRFRDLES